MAIEKIKLTSESARSTEKKLNDNFSEIDERLDEAGKIDKIYLNNEEQTITNKAVHLTVDKSTVGLGNVDNTSDLNKPISTATQSALDNKYDANNPNGFTKVESSTTNGKIKIDGVDTTVYTLPNDVVQDANYVHTDNNFTTAEKTKLLNALVKTDVVNNVTSTDTDKPLSANMGKELQDQIDNQKTIGKYLAQWNCVTGLPTTNPTVSPYTYHTGDYYRVGTVASADGTNYKPSGTQYVTGTASTVVETETDIKIDDIYFYDGTNWTLQRVVVRDVSFANITGNATDNTSLANALNGKLNKITSTSSTNQAYVKGSDGSQMMVGIAQSVMNGTIPLRSSTGTLKVATPTSTDDATTKDYVDTALSGKQASLSTAQLDAVNSGVTSATVTQVETNTTNISNKMDKTNPTGTGSLSINRRASTTVGTDSVAVGSNTEASGDSSCAEGYFTMASGFNSHAEGYFTTASGNGSHAEGKESTASGNYSHAEGNLTTAQRRSQHTFGEYNRLDTTGADGTQKGKYIEIVGNGSSSFARSNARTLDWDGNEEIAGNLKAAGLTNGTTTKTMTEILSAVEAKEVITFTDTTGWSAIDSDGFYTLTLTSAKMPIQVYKETSTIGRYSAVMASMEYDGTNVYIISDTKFAGKVIVM